jgi:TM2 domain-containing membrane protein YozV
MEVVMSDDKKDLQESPKSRLVTILLCFFLGWFGGHRFYANKIGTGILMLATMGGFGMWYFVDLVMISLGAFKDKENLPITRW